ncbi:MAG TPA: hypothetical protein VFZ04_15595 [Longimicrobiales bacterium]
MKTISTVTAALLSFLVMQPLGAQSIEFGGGVNVGSIPRAENPICRSARRLTGPGLSLRGGVGLGALRLSGTLDHVTNGGRTEVADCVARTGVSVDSVFAPAGRSATTLSASAWVPALRVLQIGAEAGWVLEHSSWFVGPAVGARYRMFAFEVAGRRYATSFDEVTTDFGPPTVRELSRESRVETSWGVIARLLLTTN